MALKIVEVIREQTAKILIDVPDDWPESKCFKIPTGKVLHSQAKWETDDTYIGNVNSKPTADDLLSCGCTGENGGAVKVTEADMPVIRQARDRDTERQRGYIDKLRMIDGMIGDHTLKPPALLYDEDAEACPED